MNCKKCGNVTIKEAITCFEENCPIKYDVKTIFCKNPKCEETIAKSETYCENCSRLCCTICDTEISEVESSFNNNTCYICKPIPKTKVSVSFSLTTGGDISKMIFEFDTLEWNALYRYQKEDLVYREFISKFPNFTYEVVDNEK